MLAKVVNDDAGILNQRGSLGFFASKLAPTGDRRLIWHIGCILKRSKVGTLSPRREDCRITSAIRVFGNKGPTIKADEDS